MFVNAVRGVPDDRVRGPVDGVRERVRVQERAVRGVSERAQRLDAGVQRGLLTDVRHQLHSGTRERSSLLNIN